MEDPFQDYIDKFLEDEGNIELNIQTLNDTPRGVVLIGQVNEFLREFQRNQFREASMIYNRADEINKRVLEKLARQNGFDMSKLPNLTKFELTQEDRLF